MPSQNRLEGTVDIIAGPGKWDLIVGFGNHEKLVFTLKGGRKISVWLDSIEHESGNGQSWNLKGSYVLSGCASQEGFYKFRGWCSTKGEDDLGRRGWIQDVAWESDS